jgi:hypothetical protein
MAIFDPNKTYASDALPSGSYLLAMVGFERKESTQKRGSFYMRARFRVLTGPSKGKSFFSSVGIDIRNPGIAGRLGLYCKAVAVKEAFDVDSDDDFRDAFMGKPFKATVKQTRNGQYTNNDIERFVLELTDAENDAADEWWEKWCAQHEGGGDAGGDDWSPDDYVDATQSGGGTRQRSSDDDIPF